MTRIERKEKENERKKGKEIKGKERTWNERKRKERKWHKGYKIHERKEKKNERKRERTWEDTERNFVLPVLPSGFTLATVKVLSVPGSWSNMAALYVWPRPLLCTDTSQTFKNPRVTADYTLMRTNNEVPYVHYEIFILCSCSYPQILKKKKPKRSAQTIVHMISGFYYRKIKPTFSHLGYKHMTFLCFINTDIILANPHSIFGISASNHTYKCRALCKQSTKYMNPYIIKSWTGQASINTYCEQVTTRWGRELHLYRLLSRHISQPLIYQPPCSIHHVFYV